MSADERLVVMLEARITEFEKRMKQAEGTGTRTYTGLRRNSRSATRQMEADMARSAGRINQALAGVSGQFGAFKRVIAGAAVAAAVKSFTTLADAATKMRNSLRVAGLEGDELNDVYGKLFQSAQRNSAPVSSLVDLYSKLTLTQKELGVNSDDLIRFTDGIAVALKVAGTDATTASGSLLQLSQALGGGIVRAEEFNSILEGTPTIAQAVARGLKEAGGSVAELRKIVVDGRLSSTALFRAFEVGSGELRQQAETTQSTVGQAFTRLGNSIVNVVGDFDQASGASSYFADVIGEVGDGLDSFDTEGFIAKLSGIAQAFADAEAAGTSWLNNVGNSDFFAGLNEAMGITKDGMLINVDKTEADAKIGVLERDVDALQAQIENNTALGFDNTEAMARLQQVRGELAALRAEAASIPQFSNSVHGTPAGGMTDAGTFYDGSGYQPPTPAAASALVSIADHPTKPDKPTKSGGGKGRGKGGGKAKEKQDDFAQEVKATRERTAALEAEAASLALVAASGEDYGDALEYARKRAELLHAAQQAGKKITPELTAEIDKLALAYTTAGLKAEEAADKLQNIKEASERGKAALEDMFGGIIDGSMSAKEAVANLLAEIAKAQLMSGAMGLLGQTSWGGSLIEGVGSLLTPSYDGGGYTGNGSRSGGLDGRGGFLAMMHPRETVTDHTKGQGGGGAEGGATSVHVTVGMDESGNLQVRKIAQQEAAKAGQAVSASIPGRIQQFNANPRRR